MIEAYVPSHCFAAIDRKVQSFDLVSYWITKENEQQKLMRILVKTENAEEILNYLESVTNRTEGFEVMLFSVESYMNRKQESQDKRDQQRAEKEAIKIQRASRHELYEEIGAKSGLDVAYLTFALLAAIVVMIGLLKNSAAIALAAW